ncbi:hypothetical protein ABW21_db0205383 [Orbilia brochopaga]|nr:hypothetical protein ABW21_db0205383 [Drechslerella brochopaga]
MARPLQKSREEKARKSRPSHAKSTGKRKASAHQQKRRYSAPRPTQATNGGPPESDDESNWSTDTEVEPIVPDDPIQQAEEMEAAIAGGMFGEEDILNPKAAIADLRGGKEMSPFLPRGLPTWPSHPGRRRSLRREDSERDSFGGEVEAGHAGLRTGAAPEDPVSVPVRYGLRVPDALRERFEADGAAAAAVPAADDKYSFQQWNPLHDQEAPRPSATPVAQQDHSGFVVR